MPIRTEPSGVQQGKSGPEPAEWVDLYGNALYRYALARISDSDTAQDLVQETFVAAVRAYKEFQGRSSTKTWLIAILKRKIVDHYRRVNTYQGSENIEAIADSVNGMFDETGHWRVVPEAWQINPGAVYEQKEFMSVVYDCLSKLPERLAEIFMLREFEELETSEIRRRLGISESNSWVMLYRARMQLRKCLESKWFGEKKRGS